MRKFLTLFVMLIFSGILAFAQDRVVTGTVTDDKGVPIEGATVRVKGSKTGTAADAMGNFRLSVPSGSTLVFSGVGITTQEVAVGNQSTVNVSLVRSGTELTGVTITTALGIRRNRNQVAYAAQSVLGEEVSKTRSSNFINNLSGKVSGLELRQTNTLGGSTNVILRGTKSITGSNQALFVIDGVPFDNSNTNSTNQRTGRGGFDYGNAAADINPDDIESITVLKGAAASALYGSRGSNGVILINTKKGSRGLGITINSGISAGAMDKSTFAKYQKEYGGGYGPFYEDATGYFFYRDPANGFAPVAPNNPAGRLVYPTSEDASYGGRFDPNLMVYQWDAFDPSSPNFGKARPWVAAANDPTTFFEKPISFNNSIYIDGGSDKGSFKVGFTRNDDKGILPNSKITKNIFNFGSTYNITSKLSASANINFSNIVGLGRYGTGYDDKNVADNFRQWWQVNTDIKEQKEAYFREKKNVTWNPADPTDPTPIYWDNVYFNRYENYENDSRNRYFGNALLNYKITSSLNLMGRVSLDSYDELQEERQAFSSTTTSSYSRFNRGYRETNYDLLLNFDKNISTDLNVKALLGGNIRKQHIESISATTNGGLIVPRIYSLSNSANPVNAPFESDARKEVDGIFGGATISYKNMLTLDATLRRDVSSTLPKGNNTYYYPSISLGWVFSKLLPTTTWLSYGKLRGNYAEVGADAPVYSTLDVYNIVTPFGSNPQASVASTKNNPNLLPEKTKSTEIGLEMAFLKSRAGFDITYYNAESFNQILPTTVSTATGYSSKFLNAGTMVNKGIELSVYGTPVQTKDFSWTINLNWTRNRNTVKSLFEGSSNLLLANFQGGVSINATLGQPFGTLRGQNFVYFDANSPTKTKTSGTPAERITSANGRYRLSTTSNEVIGNPNPDWIGGINNTLKYKNLSLSWLIDVRQGGELFSLDLYYGLATGLYPETAGLNDLGKPSRNSLANGGGIINQGVDATGKVNTVRVTNAEFGSYGYRRVPAAGFIYDASYVKLREAVLTYSLPKNIMNHIPGFKGIDLSLIGRNLWLIHKNLPYADPEENISSGNYQGYQSGAYPTTRTIAFNVKFKF
ncbi:MAG: TonB-linked outer membrane protein SusC/RagA family [Chitinophagaceae bacterium]|nr:TonB-linked outer membrane protein SusC/RagA family [Chitinophagaceae bacterium]MDB5222018.1 TonB-linked outer membrane protein SusC/RagA family [Chitinophagaceae bacterium]